MKMNLIPYNLCLLNEVELGLSLDVYLKVYYKNFKFFYFFTYI